CTNEGDDW
nr:immunoglobulin heavy chain junction region [Macaca mulatta]MPN75174.1 immunoglobulin heavy chain junction region [Macaca mulatta]MPN77839.1 immunoglobulin heavy chain junction region [Macaca mulatta]MPN77939.1 immunoglobulin heavy chain junction region [Macaca mulatta]MPN78222.1 immunoglobulin heavy chain junction region [Macaca mulatta]